MSYGGSELVTRSSLQTEIDADSVVPVVDRDLDHPAADDVRARRKVSSAGGHVDAELGRGHGTVIPCAHPADVGLALDLHRLRC